MASDGVIVVREKGNLIPLAYVESILKENPSCWASALAQDNALVLDQCLFDETPENKPITVEDFDEMQKLDKDLTTVYWFGFGVRSDDAVQPHIVLVDEKNLPMLVAFTEGDFSAFAQTNSSFPDDHHANAKFLTPTLKKLWTSSGQKMDALISELSDELTNQTIKNMIGQRGSISIVSGQFPPDTFYKGAGTSTYPWGWVSKTFGYVEQPAAAPTAEPVAAGGGLIRRKRPVTTPAPTPEPAKPAEVKPAEPAPKTDVQAAQKQNVENAEGEYPMVGPDDSEEGKTLRGKQRKNWFQHNTQFVPPNYWEVGAKAPSLWKKGQRPLKDLKDLGRALPKDKTTLVTTTAIPTPPAGPRQIEPVLAPEVVAAVQNQKLFTLDQNSRVIPLDPKQLQAMEAKNVPYFDAYGVPENYIDGKEYNWFVNLGKVDMNKIDVEAKSGLLTLANIAFTERNRRIRLEHELDQVTQPDTVDTSGTGVVTAKPAAAAGGLIRRRR